MVKEVIVRDVCAWCGKHVRTYKAMMSIDFPDVVENHGICSVCEDKHFPGV